MHQITGRPDNLAFFISGIQPDTIFDLRDIRPAVFRIRIDLMRIGSSFLGECGSRSSFSNECRSMRTYIKNKKFCQRIHADLDIRQKQKICQSQKIMFSIWCPYNSLHNNSLQHNSLQHNSLHHYSLHHYSLHNNSILQHFATDTTRYNNKSLQHNSLQNDLLQQQFATYQ
jgi:hypothetical protein